MPHCNIIYLVTKDGLKSHLAYPDKSQYFNQYQNRCWCSLHKKQIFTPENEQAFLKYIVAVAFLPCPYAIALQTTILQFCEMFWNI